MRLRTLLAAALLVPAVASSQDFTYTFTGTGSGTFGSTSFTDRIFAVTLNRLGSTPATPSDPSVSRYSVFSGDIRIVGVGAAAFATPLSIFVNRATSTVGFGLETLDFFDVTDASLATYDLGSPFSPIEGTASAGQQFQNVDTDAGVLTFTDMASRGTFVADPASIPVTAAPEPATVTLMVTGLGGLMGFARRRRQRA